MCYIYRQVLAAAEIDLMISRSDVEEIGVPNTCQVSSPNGTVSLKLSFSGFLLGQCRFSASIVGG